MKKLVLIVFVFILAGCAVGNKYNYRTSPMALPVRPVDHKAVVVSVEDCRPYVLSGQREASFVGIQRGGYGNPFDVTTVSGGPMTEDMAAAIVRGLNAVGYSVTYVLGEPEILLLLKKAAKEKATRIVVLKVYDWKSDIYLGTTLSCDLQLSVFDGKGQLLAKNTMKFEEEIGGAQIGADKNSQTVSDEFAKRIGYLFSKEEIRNALE
jgi:hypothetical protein